MNNDSLRKLAIGYINDNKPIEIDDAIKILSIASDEYHNGESELLTDAEYDKLYLAIKSLVPSHKFFIGIGSTIRGDKVTLPNPMGSLDQVYDNEFKKWIKKHGLLNEVFVITSKMDGVSGQIIYDSDGELQIAFSRGDGIQGADITRHIKKIPGIPLKIDSKFHNDKGHAIRVEIEMSESKFNSFCKDCDEFGYRTYKNPRSAVAGLINSKKIPKWAYQYFSIFAYDLIGSNINKLEQLRLLSDLGFNIVNYTSFFGKYIDDELLTEIIKFNVLNLDFAQDGVVIEVNDANARAKLTKEQSRESLNPAYAKKFKITTENNIAITTCVGVIWSISKNGLLKPRVEFEPVNLNGVTITFANGHNAKYIVDNCIGPGAVLKITRSGDVIPYILDVISQADEPDLPSEHEFGEYGWKDSNRVEFELLEIESNYVVRFKQMLSFFRSLGVDALGTGNLNKFCECGFSDEASIINMTREEMVEIVGKNGNKIYDSMRNILGNIPEYEFAGSTACFGTGIGVRKMKQIYNHHKKIRGLKFDDICNTPGFDIISAEKVFDGMPDYLNLLEQIKPDILIFTNKVKSMTTGDLENTVWVFTGVRSKDAETKIKEQGGTIGSGISKKTTHLVCKDPTSNSNKMKKAKELGIKIMDLKELINVLG